MSARIMSLGVGLSLAVALVGWVPASAEVAGDVSGSGTAIAGWQGQQPEPVGMGVTDGGRTTAVFTTAGGTDGSSLWVGDRPAGGTWTSASLLASGVGAGTADFAENASGAAVAVWEAADSGSSDDLMVSMRSAAGGGWSSPATVSTDSAVEHGASVGINAEGVATVAYLDDQGTGVRAFTRQSTATGWGEAVEHSTAATHQVMIGVAPDGFATLAWTQDNANGRISAYGSQRWVSPASWETPVLIHDDVVAQSLLDVTVHETPDSTYGDTGAIAYYRHPWPGEYILGVARTDLGIGSSGCSVCGKWVLQNLGQSASVPSAAVAVTNRGDTVLAKIDGDLYGGPRTLYAVVSNGNGIWDSQGTVSDGGAPDKVQVASDGDRVTVSWVDHTPQGDVLDLRGLSISNNRVFLDPDTTHLGPVSGNSAMSVAPSHDVEAVWPDDSTDPTALRSFTKAATVMVSPEEEFWRSRDVSVQWAGDRTRSSGTGYDVRTRRATAVHGFGTPDRWRTDTTSATGTFHAVSGGTYCFSTRRRDAKGHLSSWSGEGCTAVPFDDVRLSGHGWARQKSSASYHGSRLRATARGSRLRIRSVGARSLALLVTRRHVSGSVHVQFGSVDLGTFNTRGVRRFKAVIPLATFRAPRTGTLTLTVTSTHKPVYIDGLFLSAK